MTRLFRPAKLLALAMLLSTISGIGSAQQIVASGEGSDHAAIRIALADGELSQLSDEPLLSNPATDVDAYMDPGIVEPGCCYGADYWGWTLLPTGLVYPTYLAGVSQPRLGLTVQHVADNHDEPTMVYDGTLGGAKGLIRYGNRNPYDPQGFQVDVRAAAQVRLNFEEDMDVQATDYRVGVPFTYAWGNKQIKFGYWHVSSHLGDEFIIRNAPVTRWNYAKDSLVFGYSEYLSDRLRIYGEASWAFWSDVAEPWEFQFGLEYAPRCPTGFHGEPFFATNVNLREEVGFGGNFVVQTGWAWRADQGGGLLRVGVHYYNGKSSQRSFWNQHESQIGLGIWYDY